MHRVGIMQPYFLPYLGYFQLIAAVDDFVLYDDSQYIKNGWSNRNRILVRGKPHMITLPVEHSSSTGTYRERRYVERAGEKLLKTIGQAYARAPQVHEIMPVLDRILSFEDRTVAALNGHAVRLIAGYLGLGTRIHDSSSIERPLDGDAQRKVIAICKALGATTYVNSAGGRHLYDRETFAAEQLDLRFLQPHLRPHKELGAPFVPGLSIIDLLMSNRRDELAAMMEDYELD